MNHRLVVLIKFNKTDLHLPRHKGARFKKTFARKEWWENRLAILKDIVWPSLERQTNTDFDVVAPFSTDIDPELCKETQRFLFNQGAFVCWDDRKRKDFVEPVEFLKELYFDDYDAITLVNHDSDDIYHPRAFQLLNDAIRQREVTEGGTYIFRNGYVYDAPTRRLAHYMGGGSPPPFYAMTFAKRALESQQQWDMFCREYGIRVEHPHLDSCAKKFDMPDGKFLYYFHNHNVTSSWQNPHHASKIQQLVTGDRKHDILEDFGISSD